MKQVKQTSFGTQPTLPDVGNCLAACVASILELPISQVPNFSFTPNGEDWYEDKLLTWLKTRGFTALFVKYDPELGRLGCYCVASGKSPRGDHLHAVVYKDGKVVWDPHPDWRIPILGTSERASSFLCGEGLSSKPVDMIFLVPLDPAVISQPT